MSEDSQEPEPVGIREEDYVVTTPEGFVPAPLSAEEVPLEASRKDETTLLASDRVRYTEDGELVVEQ